MIVPRETYVVIEPFKDKPIDTFLELPEDMQAKPQARGRVTAVGPKVTEVKPGDIVHYERFDWSAGPGDTIIIKEGEILARETR